MCINLTEPMHLHGVISGFFEDSVSSRQILHDFSFSWPKTTFAARPPLTFALPSYGTPASSSYWTY